MSRCEAPAASATGASLLWGSALRSELRKPNAKSLPEQGKARLAPCFEQVWPVSKCGERVQRRTRQWLDHHDFAALTGIPREHIRFCPKRPDKALHCADLGITHFVVDKLDVHRALRGVVAHRYLFGPQRTPPPTWVRHTLTWAAVETEIMRVFG